MKENKGMNYATMQNSTRFGDTMAVLKTIKDTGCPTGKIARKVIYQGFDDCGVPGKYAATALRLPGTRVFNMRSFYNINKMIEGMEKKFGGTGVSKKTSVTSKPKGKKTKTKVPARVAEIVAKKTAPKKTKAKKTVAKKPTVKRVKVPKVEKPKVIKLQGPDVSAHSPTEEITDISYARIERIESLGTPGFHPTADDIADELSLMGTYL